MKTALKWLETLSNRPNQLVEPFAGGACISLAAVEGRLVHRFQRKEVSIRLALIEVRMFFGQQN